MALRARRSSAEWRIIDQGKAPKRLKETVLVWEKVGKQEERKCRFVSEQMKRGRASWTEGIGDESNKNYSRPHKLSWQINALPNSGCRCQHEFLFVHLKQREILKIWTESWEDWSKNHLASQAASLAKPNTRISNELYTKIALFTKFQTQFYRWTSWRASPPPRQPWGWREATTAAIHIEKIIVNEKSLRGIMLSTGSLFPFPPSALRSTWRSGGFSLSFGIQELLPGN